MSDDAETLAEVTEWFAAIVDAISDGDPTGHIPDCGYTEERMICGCAALGGRLHAVLAARIERARAGEGALRERLEALVVPIEDGGPTDDEPLTVGDLRAALTETAGDPT